MDEAFVRTGTELGIAQMLAAGATLTVDMYYHEAAVARVAERAGYRLVAGETIIGYPAPGAPTPKDGLRNAERFLAEWSGHPLVQPAPSPHAVYTTDPDLLRAALRLCERHQAPFLTHLSESRDEIATVASRHGQSPIAYLEGLGVLAVPTIAAHVIYPQPGDVEILARRRVAVAHCPQSNLHMGESVAPLREYLDRGVPVGLGSDGSGSAPGVDLLAEAVLAGRLMKLRAGRADEVRAQDLLRLLTADAAAALRRPDLGTLTAGALADLVVFEPAGPAPAQAVTDPFARVIYATQHRRVAVTVVDGRVLYERGEYPTIDMERLRQEVRAQGQRIQQAIA